jgi:ligand-binding SRPBCC domain-containing protein
MYKLERIQNIPIDLKKAWSFFSSPDNLKLITPDNLNFNVLAKSDAGEMYPGMIITYTLSPLFHVSVNWATEITQVKDFKYFIDNQIKGPYKIWHHEHHFKETADGVEMKDILFYELPYGLLGRLVHKLFVKKKVDEIFNYRSEKIKELFGQAKSS